jgi:hypothetical protein
MFRRFTEKVHTLLLTHKVAVRPMIHISQISCILFQYTMLLIILLFHTNQALSQQITQPDIPTPNAAALGEYGQIPVNFYNGLPNISVPLHTFRYKDLAVPIELNYHAGGNRPDNYPGWVGLGWNLQAGGAVTRIVNGLTDEITADDMNAQNVTNGYQYQTNQEYGYFFRSKDFDRSDWASQSFLDSYLSTYQLATGRRTFDGQPDEFMLP